MNNLKKCIGKICHKSVKECYYIPLLRRCTSSHAWPRLMRPKWVSSSSHQSVVRPLSLVKLPPSSPPLKMTATLFPAFKHSLGQGKVLTGSLTFRTRRNWETGDGERKLPLSWWVYKRNWKKRAHSVLLRTFFLTQIKYGSSRPPALRTGDLRRFQGRAAKSPKSRAARRAAFWAK